MNEKRILILAGPNGAGKTTFAREFLPKEMDCPLFVNADLIAQGLSPFAPELAEVEAGRIMLQRIKELARSGESFGFETTLAGKSYKRLIREWREGGYVVNLIFLKLNSVELAIERVATRVAQGGHNVPAPTIARRFGLGLRNFENEYRELVDRWILYDNSGSMPNVLAEGRSDR